MNDNIIPIFFTIDDEYAKFACTAITSIIENASKDYKYKINIVHRGLSEENMTKLSNLSNENFDIEFKKMKDEIEKIAERDENTYARFDYFALSIYFRIFIADMFPEYKKGLYLDSDIIVLGDISKLYNNDIQDNIIGACVDMSIQDVPEFFNYVENAVGIDRTRYVNSGVLLMNLEKMREEKFSLKFMELMSTYYFETVAPDQDYINALCAEKICFLNQEWDVMPMNKKEEYKEPKLIHYNLFKKPWCYDNIQYERYFWEYAKKTEYSNQIYDYKKNYSDERKERDKHSLERLLKKAITIPNNDITFKGVYESGEDIRL